MWKPPKVKSHEMKNKQTKTVWDFLYIKYRQFWSISLEHFVEHKPQVSEECDSEFGFILVILAKSY